VGIVDEGAILDGRAIRPGDAIIALASSGLHTNGFSLARRIIFGELGLSVDDPFPDETDSVADVLLRVHRSYLRSIRPRLVDGSIHGLAHITGGGLTDNVPRVLPEGTAARFDRNSWELPHVFRVLQHAGGVDDAEMFRAFNMGIGMVVIADPAAADSLLAGFHAEGEDAWIAGEVVAGDRKVLLS
jgi:phosphoribosylformylglycinamidine cyclo-ligase